MAKLKTKKEIILCTTCGGPFHGLSHCEPKKRVRALDLRITSSLADGAIEIQSGRHVFLIDIQKDGNHFWFVRYTNNPNWNTASSYSHLDMMLREIAATPEKDIGLVP